MDVSLFNVLEPPQVAAFPRRAREPDPAPGADRLPIITRRGRLLHVCTVTAEDASLLAALLVDLSERTTRLRFFRPLHSRDLVWREAVRMAHGHPRLQVALVAVTTDQGAERALAVAELAHDPAAPTLAEFGVVVAETISGKGSARRSSSCSPRSRLCEASTHRRPRCCPRTWRLAARFAGLGSSPPPASSMAS